MDMARQKEKEENGDPRGRCVLLVGEAAAVPSSLVGALDRRGMEIAITRQPPQVLVELLEAGVVAQPRTGNAEHRGTAAREISIIMVEPEHQPRIGELRRTVAQYFPGVRCWRYESGTQSQRPRLTAFDEEPCGSAEPPTLEATDDAPAHLKAAGQRLRSVLIQVDRPHPELDGPLVSEEELAMLLSPGPLPPLASSARNRKAEGNP
jgi:hypothetical protein